jgi:hypothetical protein
MFAPVRVGRAELPPFRCIFSGLSDGPFVDTNCLVEPVPGQLPRGYVHETAAFQIGQAIGMVGRAEHERVVEELAAVRAELARVSAELEESDRQIQAIDGLTKRDYVVRKAPGRKPKRREVEDVAA